MVSIGLPRSADSGSPVIVWAALFARSIRSDGSMRKTAWVIKSIACRNALSEESKDLCRGLVGIKLHRPTLRGSRAASICVNAGYGWVKYH